MELKFKGVCAKLCCEHFPISQLTDADLRAAYLAWKAKEPEYLRDNGAEGVLECVPVDIHLIYPMIRYSHTCEETGIQYFSCAHWNTDTKLCNIYEIRPVMCRDFPYRGMCQYKDRGCTLEVVEVDDGGALKATAS